ncbi:hypothetical protein Y032_0005g2581 [Ancylostoma ceylanicum]|nr:hypothetical protein Y032_0005g2581 [Ancylostoma ceylanicum]
MLAPWKAREGPRERLRDEDGYRIRAAGVCMNGESKAVLFAEMLDFPSFRGSFVSFSRAHNVYVVVFLDGTHAVVGFSLSPTANQCENV